MVESYNTKSWTRRTSRAVIQEMKKNMQKVPKIQKKSQQYHQKEKQEAESILDSMEDEQIQLVPIQIVTNTQEPESLREKIRTYIGF
jgi:hypothetical protein